MAYVFDVRAFYAAFPQLLAAAGNTIILSIAAVIGGLLLGTLIAAMRKYGPSPVSFFSAAYVAFIRNTPLLIQAFFAFFGLPSLGIRLTPMEAAALILAINNSAYIAEIVRSGLNSIPQGQIQAGMSLGFSGLQIFRYIVIGPVIKKMYPALCSQFNIIVLSTSVVSLIGTEELTGAANTLQSLNFKAFEIYVAAAIIYIVISWSIKLIALLIGNFYFNNGDNYKIVLQSANLLNLKERS
jgi:polar amino acid transport system permease protein